MFLTLACEIKHYANTQFFEELLLVATLLPVFGRRKCLGLDYPSVFFAITALGDAITRS